MPINDHLLLQHIPQTLIQLDPDGYITFANPAAASLPTNFN
ncbi:PAS domain-containing protein [Spirosoma profusum]|nr:PAS domain-containing protein [Spirosoma profusum]